MNPRDDQHDDSTVAVPPDLDSAYRALPPAAPGAALDARVRAAVRDELDASPRARAGRFAGLRLRMPLLPLATAATVLLAVAAGYLALPSRPNALAMRPVETVPDLPVVPAATRGPAEPGAGSSTRAASSTVTATPKPPLAAIRAPEQVDTSQRTLSQSVAVPEPLPVDRYSGADAVPAAPPAAPAAVPAAPAAAEVPPPPARTVARSVGNVGSSTNSLEEVIVTESRKSASAQPGQVDRLYSQSRDEAPVTLDAVRLLLQDGKRRAARKLLQRWQRQNPDASIPEDLQALLEKAPHR